MALAEALKRARAAAGLTQEELAERAAISARTVSDVERGLRVRIYKDTAGRLADALALGGAPRSEFERLARGREPHRASRFLPLPPTRLIGREAELNLLIDTVGRADIRVVTVTGPGGVGKTRLALEVAARESERRPVLFVELGGTTDAEDVVPQLARAAETPGAIPETATAVAEHLPQNCLIVLDTFEHLLEAATDVASLIAACPTATVLVTSREALRIRGEHEVAMSTLALPREATLDAALRSPAVELFMERASAVRPGFQLTDELAPVLSDVCRRLNGLPLAIELMAALVKHLDVGELAQRLSPTLDLLVAGPRDLPARQRTMRATVAWSYGLLDARLQTVFRDLSVFAGGWTGETATAVCGRDVGRELRDLTDKSLIKRATATGSRLDMLDVIREYGAELGVSDATKDRHLDYFVHLAEEAESHIGVAGQEAWLQRLDEEHDNLRSALRRGAAQEDGSPALRLSGAIWRFWMLRGHMSEGRAWLREALATKASDAHLRAKALWGLAWLAYHQGDYAETARCGEEMLALSETTASAVDLRNALTIRGILALADGRHAEAIGLSSRCVELMRGGADRWLLATSLANLGVAAAHSGDARAEAVLQEARDLYAALGDRIFEARSVLYLGYAALVKGRGDPVGLFRESLTAFWELDDLWGVAEGIEALAAAAAGGEDTEKAATLAGASQALRERINTNALPADHALLERNLLAAAASVSAQRWQELVERGRSMPLGTVVEYALQSD